MQSYPLVVLTPERKAQVRRLIPAILTTIEFDQIEAAFAEAFADQQIFNTANELLFGTLDTVTFQEVFRLDFTSVDVSNHEFAPSDLIELEDGLESVNYVVVCFDDQQLPVLYDGYGCMTLSVLFEMLVAAKYTGKFAHYEQVY